jgi:integrase
MGRPPLPIGTFGKIRTYQTATGWRARTKYRDADGVTRPVERIGRTEPAAVRALKSALRDRTAPSAGTVTGDTRFREMAEQWFATVQAAAEHGARSPTTVDQYRGHLDRNVLPGLGALRLREATVPRLDAYLAALQRTRGTATAKTCRAVVSGVLGLAVRHGALDGNPVRDVGRIEGGRRNAPRALTAAERAQWLAKLEADETAARKDLPDLTRFMLATGVRIGEALAVHWPDLDLEAGTVAVDHNVVRVKGSGLVRKSTKTAAGERTLRLPSWALDMLRKRHADTDDPDGPVFPDSIGGLRDPSNTSRDFRDARDAAGFGWVTSHVFRKTAATMLDEAGLSARAVADQLGHSRPSMTQDVYMGRKIASPAAAEALEGAFDVESAGSVGVKGGGDLDGDTARASDLQGKLPRVDLNH